MSVDAEIAQAPSREVFYRHRLAVRLTHWINALALFFLLGSGLNIFNAHPQLYWGAKGDEYDKPILSIQAVDTDAGPKGVTTIGPWHFTTTGVLGWSKVEGVATARAWPSWLTIPSFQDLADARHWHFLFAWILALNSATYLAWGLWKRHLQIDIWPTRADLRTFIPSVIDHLKLKHPTGEAAKRYNILQRLAYLGVLTLIATMILSGLSMSPGFDAFAPWLPDLLGGRQSARTIHFFSASLIVLFVFVHLVEVVLAGPLNEVRSMITGWFTVPEDHK
ncbi:MAG: cytochrome b/b6 domain-containing protein [Rhizomicrobium sp.]|nr:cytochrome b/b6 domain-containing protein [Rhizomicrobium sp.]